MSWYAAHAVVYFELTDGPQDCFQVYENVLLIQAETPDEAWEKAAVVARQDEDDGSGGLRVGGRPARCVFGGIRKVVTVLRQGDGPDGQLGDGDELTYSEFVVADRQALDRLISGQEVELLYTDEADVPEA